MASEVGSYTNKIHYIKKKILEELTKKQYAQVFMRPMDKRHGDYQNVIRKPMDLGTIITWVQNRFYRNADELIADLRLVYRNWFALKKGSPILCRPANQLQKFVENKLVQMPDGEEFEIKKDSRMTARSIKDFPWLQLNGTQEMEPLSTFIPIKTEPDSNGKVEFSVTKFSHQVVSLIKEGLHLTRRSYQALVPQPRYPQIARRSKGAILPPSTTSTACKSLELEEPFGPAAMAKMARLSDEEEKVEVQEITEKQRKKKRHKHHKKSKKHRLNERNEEQPK
ncbi:GL19664 [Drosophila persimilis]|uniref:GL19664 n=1 Tax=Drosophila persimilis TaxID=7234 RepID=B4G7Z4_DROPE|nr:GL19664 [Drosophila persimilis]